MKEKIVNYTSKIIKAFDDENMKNIEQLGISLHRVWKERKNVYICGNGGSAGNAIHLANDFNYGIDKDTGIGLKIEALPANSSVVTCIANDEGYENIFSQQLMVKAEKGDVLIALSGSGNSQNIINAINTAKNKGMEVFSILGYSGGKCKDISDYPIHFKIDDMQISEDLQLIVGHILMQWLCENRPY